MTGEGGERAMAARGPLPYADGIKTVADDEGAVIDGIIAAMTHESGPWPNLTDARCGRRMRRARPW